MTCSRPRKKGLVGKFNTDAISALLQHEEVFAYRFSGKRYDCGNKLDYLKATVDYGLKHAEIGDDFRDYLANR